MLLLHLRISVQAGNSGGPCGGEKVLGRGRAQLDFPSLGILEDLLYLYLCILVCDHLGTAGFSYTSLVICTVTAGTTRIDPSVHFITPSSHLWVAASKKAML